jgi:hypothetical protein
VFKAEKCTKSAQTFSQVEKRTRYGQPPTVTARDGWPVLYATQSQGLSVHPDIETAVDWTNKLTTNIHTAK